jgi:hypothetical protein
MSKLILSSILVLAAYASTLDGEKELRSYIAQNVQRLRSELMSPPQAAAWSPRAIESISHMAQILAEVDFSASRQPYSKVDLLKKRRDILVSGSEFIRKNCAEFGRLPYGINLSEAADRTEDWATDVVQFSLELVIAGFLTDEKAKEVLRYGGEIHAQSHKIGLHVGAVIRLYEAAVSPEQMSSAVRVVFDKR